MTDNWWIPSAQATGGSSGPKAFGTGTSYAGGGGGGGQYRDSDGVNYVSTGNEYTSGKFGAAGGGYGAYYSYTDSAGSNGSFGTGGGGGGGGIIMKYGYSNRWGTITTINGCAGGSGAVLIRWGY